MRKLQQQITFVMVLAFLSWTALSWSAALGAQDLVTTEMMEIDSGIHPESVPETSLYQEPTADQQTQLRISQLESEIDELRASFWNSRGCQKNCAPKCDDPRGLTLNLGMVFSKPHMKESFEATVIDFGTGSLNLVPFDFEHDITPKIELGYFGNNAMGVRGRYWGYDHDANPLTAVATPTTFPGVSSVSVIYPAAISTGAPGDVLSVESGLQVHTFDLEGAMRGKLAGASIVASAGVRYAKLDQSFHSVVMRGATPIGSLDWSRRFEGAGLTAGADASRSLGSSGLSFVGAARGSLLFGRKELRRTTVGDVTPPSAAVPPTIVFDDADEVSGIFELVAGLQYSRATPMGKVFVRGTYDTQLWTAAGAPTLTFLGFEGIGLAFGIDR
ncbi:Lpg1974 family pore-forming outer membrane protein [Stieleria varia]|uniref:Uncharacterized protein n=1 Tax=Stieleria varia TaxID=2528005 RepID=A0A5C6B3K1_9BACT|nr:Lpg1974 family pore-forming outer membrane protein [Stieleria varia]TWU06337.1 hypothetical protein Pla52n_20580 [Stieleria varia]